MVNSTIVMSNKRREFKPRRFSRTMNPSGLTDGRGIVLSRKPEKETKDSTQQVWMEQVRIGLRTQGVVKTTPAWRSLDSSDPTCSADLRLRQPVSRPFLPRENPASHPEMTVNARKASATDMQVRHLSRRVGAGHGGVLIRFLNRVSQVRILPRALPNMQVRAHFWTEDGFPPYPLSHENPAIPEWFRCLSTLFEDVRRRSPEP